MFASGLLSMKEMLLVRSEVSVILNNNTKESPLRMSGVSSHNYVNTLTGIPARIHFLLLFF